MDPRDKVHGPLCIASDDVRRCIRPDYVKKTVLDVYTDVVRYYLAQPEHKLDFLGHALYQDGRKVVTTPQVVSSIVPSGVPKLSANVDVSPIPKVLHVPDDLERKRLTLYNKGALPSKNGGANCSLSPTW